LVALKNEICFKASAIIAIGCKH